MFEKFEFSLIDMYLNDFLNLQRMNIRESCDGKHYIGEAVLWTFPIDPRIMSVKGAVEIYMKFRVEDFIPTYLNVCSSGNGVNRSDMDLTDDVRSKLTEKLTKKFKELYIDSIL